MISIDVIRQRNLRNKKMKSRWPDNIWTLTMFDVKAKNCSKLGWKRNRKYVILYWNIRFLWVIDVCFGKYLTNNKVVVLPLQATLKLFVSILNEWNSLFCLIQSLRVMLMESAVNTHQSAWLIIQHLILQSASSILLISFRLFLTRLKAIIFFSV